MRRSSQNLSGHPVEEVLFFFKENSFLQAHPSKFLLNCPPEKLLGLCVHKHKILNYHHHLRVIHFSWKIKFVMGPLIQQSTGYEKQPHININGVLKIALKASFWCLFLRVDDKTKCAILIFIWNFKHFSL